MGDKYGGSEVLQMAVEIERKGKAFYEGVAQGMREPKLQEVFRFLADEEVRHENVFKNMLKGIEEISPVSPYDNTEMILYFRSLVDRKIFPSRWEGEMMKQELSDPSAAVHVALSLEKDSILFYHEMLPVIEEKDHGVVQQIIKEERNHIHRILQLKEEMSI